MAEVIWMKAATDQLDQIASYVRLFDPNAADRLTKRLRSLGDSLATFPARGRPAGRGFRELVSARPYILRYKVIDDTVLILRVRHSARRPLD